jgi:hypothetical protein
MKESQNGEHALYAKPMRSCKSSTRLPLSRLAFAGLIPGHLDKKTCKSRDEERKGGGGLRTANRDEIPRDETKG